MRDCQCMTFRAISDGMILYPLYFEYIARSYDPSYTLQPFRTFSSFPLLYLFAANMQFQLSQNQNNHHYLSTPHSTHIPPSLHHPHYNHHSTMVDNSQEYRLKYWATRSSVRLFACTAHSFACTAHSFACSGLLASLAPSAALTRSHARSLVGK